MTCSHPPLFLSRGRAAWLLAVAALTMLAGGSSIAQGQGARGRALFEEAPSAERAAQALAGDNDPTKRRGRRVRADVAALHDTSDASAADITLNLFDDVQLRARRTRLEPTLHGGSIWHASLLDLPGDATIAVNDGVMAGTVFAGDRVYEILYAGDGEYEVREIEPSAFPTDDPPADLPVVEPDPQAEEMDALVAAEMAADSASQIDVMVVWTPAARSAAGGTAAMQSLVDLSVANTNTAYANSNVTQRLRLVYAGEISYTESAATTDLNRLQGLLDGYMDSVHSVRTTYGADIVTLIGNGYAASGFCGIGFLMSSVSTGFASTAFNVIDRTCSAGNNSFAHELGHNMGLQHDPANAGSTPAYSYAFGYHDPGGSFRTVMSYGSAPRVKYFSNPAVTYGGKVTGTSTQNNALALNNTAYTVANFRQATVGGSCTYSLGSTSTSVGSGSATGSVSVVAGSGCAWTASSNASWIAVTSGASGTSNGAVGYSVAANSGSTSRSGTMTIAGKTFTVTQAAAACGAFSLSPASYSAPSSGGTTSVTVTGTTGCARTATSNASWITVTSGASGTGTGTVSLSVASNTSSGSRTGTVTIGGQTFTVTQAAATCGAFSLMPTSYTSPAAGASVNVTVSGTAGCARSATSQVSWVTVTSGASGTGSGTVSLSVAANTTAASRSGYVIIGGQTFSVMQPAATCGAFSLSPTSTSVTAAGGAVSVTVSGSTGCARSATSNASWITVTSGASGTGSGTVALSVAANTAGTSRTGTATIGGQTFTVTQAAAACGAFSLSPTSYSAPASGGTVSVSVSGTSGCARTATSNASWITVTSGASGTGSGTVALSVAANTAGTSRTGTVTIGGQTFTVTQAAAACGAFGLSPTSYSAPASGGTASVSVSGTSGCSRTATSNASWITVTSGASGSGSGTVALSVAANTATTSRTGTVTIGGQTFTVAQSATACAAFTVSPTSYSAPSSGGAVTLNVTGTAGCGRTAISNASWISVTSGASGSGSGTVSLSVAGNTGASRTGTATVAGKTVTVSQAAAAKVSISSLTANVSFPTAAGTTITWTASASGGSSSILYQFWRYRQSTNTWTMVQNYSTSPSYTWSSQASDAGTHALQVWVKQATSTAQFDVVRSFGYFSLTAAAASTTSTSSSTSSATSSGPLTAAAGTPSPLVAGTPLSWTINTSGGIAPLQFKFWVYSATTGAWTVARDYGTSNVLSYTPPTSGRYAMQAWVRNAGSTANYTVMVASGYFDVAPGSSGESAPPPTTTSGPAPSSVLLTSDRPAPFKAGVAVTLTATPLGTTASTEHKFWEYADGAWRVLRNYGASKTVEWQPTAGTRALQVWTRRVGSTVDREAYAATGFVTVLP